MKKNLKILLVILILLQFLFLGLFGYAFVKKEDGFILIESLISLFIITLVVTVISYGLHNVYSIVLKNEEKIEMIQLAKSKIENMKNSMENNDYTISYKVGKYNIDEIVKNEKYHRNLNIKVSSFSDSISLETNVVKR